MSIHTVHPLNSSVENTHIHPSTHTHTRALTINPLGTISHAELHIAVYSGADGGEAAGETALCPAVHPSLSQHLLPLQHPPPLTSNSLSGALRG